MNDIEILGNLEKGNNFIKSVEEKKFLFSLVISYTETSEIQVSFVYPVYHQEGHELWKTDYSGAMKEVPVIWKDGSTAQWNKYNIPSLRDLESHFLSRFLYFPGAFNCFQATADELNRTIPVSVTMGKVGNHIIVDPNADEWASMDARITITTDSDGNICALQKGGNDGFTLDEIIRCGEISINVGSKIREKLKQIQNGA